MESKNLAIICAIIIICVIIGAAVVALNQPEETQIKVLSNSSLYNGDNITVQLTTENDTPIVNQAVNVTIIDANGGRNVQQLITNEEGRASLTLNGVTVGNYTLECIFGGNNEYKQSNCTSNLEIKEKVKQEKTSYSSLESRGYHWSNQCGEYVKPYYSDPDEFYRTHGYYGGYMQTPDGRLVEIG